MTRTFAQYKQEAEAFGSSLEDRDDWLVSLTRTRDSDCLAESNFAIAKQRLESAANCQTSECDLVEVQRFGHWACGWIEHIFVHPSLAAEVEKIEGEISDYPILDADDFSERESEAAFESWSSYGCREFAEAMQNEFDLMDSTVDLLCKSPDWTLYIFENSEPYALCTEGDTVHVQAYGGQTNITRDQMAACLRKLRIETRKVV